MKIKITLSCVLLLAFGALNAQEIKLIEAEPTGIYKCYSAEYEQQLRSKIANAETIADFESWMKTMIIKRKNDPSQNDVTSYQLPLVFHIIYDINGTGGAENVPAGRVHAQLQQLNKDFADLAGSMYAVRANTGIQFCLAKTNPGGAQMAEPGIDRVNRANIGLGTPPYASGSADLESTMKASTIWDPTRYINIWVVPLTNNILGYSTFPASSGLPGINNPESSNNAGVVIIPRTVGSKSSPATACDASGSGFNAGGTLSHELGHFFGLRHIWGDSNCGNDYCDDTPIHQAANYGKFTHPKSNNCLPPTVDEMFENQMDYTDDEQRNIFTANQVARMQTVMLNSPRRASLATSNVQRECVTSDTISFYPCRGAVVKETGNTGDCPRYRILPVQINIEDRTSAAATINIFATGTATNGVDYIIENPVINFAAGEGDKYVNVRIIDDGVPEGVETINLSYSISGTGVKAGLSNQLFAITIVDDDSLAISQNEITLMENDFSVGAAGWSIAATANNPNVWTVGVDPDDKFGSRFLYVTNNAAASPRPYTYSASTSGATVVLTPLINAIGMKSLNMSFRYAIQGASTGSTPRDYAQITYSYPSNPLSFKVGSNPLLNSPNPVTVNAYNLLPLLDSGKFHMSFYFANGVGTPGNPPFGLDDIKISGLGTTVETQLGHTRTLKAFAGKTNNFLSQNDDQIIATVAIPSSDVDCMSAAIQQAGNGKVDITTGAGTFKRSEKVVKISSTTASSASYKMTLYFTQDEMGAWAAIDRPNLKVMKVADNVSLASVVTQADIITPVFGDSVTNGKGFYTYTFNSAGFSQFFLVEPGTVLPLHQLTFNVKVVRNSIHLNWHSGNEFLNRGFEVERSLDGTNFSKIDFVEGKGRGNTPGNFDYALEDADVQAGVTYYYRLKQVDTDGRFTYSTVRSAKLGERHTIVVTPNPVRNKTRIVSEKAMKADVELMDTKGAVVKKWQGQTISSNGLEINLAGLPSGLYLIRITDTENSISSFKLVKE